MTIKKDILTINFTPDGIKEVRGLVLHSMWGTYQGSIAWFKNPDAKASCHYLISAEGEITQMVEEKDMAWHAGIIDDVAPDWVRPNPNWYTIGIEFEDKRDPNWQYPQAQRDAGAWLIERIVKAHNIQQDHIVLHKQLNPSRRSDPVGWFAWEWALAKLGTTGDDLDRAIKLLQDYKESAGHGNYEGAMRQLLGDSDANQKCQVDLTNCREANENAKKVCEKAIEQALLESDANWQKQLESANSTIESLRAELKTCQENKCEDLSWKELLYLAIKRFPN